MIKQKGISVMRIKDIREDRDLTQNTIAEFLHVKQNTYSQYENGQRKLPIDMLIALARYYETSTDYLLGLTDEMQPYPPTVRGTRSASGHGAVMHICDRKKR